MATNTSDFFTFSKTAGTAKNLQKPTDGGDNNLWGGYINVDLDTIVGAVNATSDLIADANQNELVDFTATGNAVNHVGITNAATGNGPTIEAKGDDPNVDLNLTPKGTGEVNISKVDIDSGTIDGTNVTVGSSKTLDVSAGTFTTSASQNQTIVSSGGSLSGGRTLDVSAGTFTTSASQNQAIVSSGLSDGMIVDRQYYKYALSSYSQYDLSNSTYTIITRTSSSNASAQNITIEAEHTYIYEFLIYQKLFRDNNTVGNRFFDCRLYEGTTPRSQGHTSLDTMLAYGIQGRELVSGNGAAAPTYGLFQYKGAIYYGSGATTTRYVYLAATSNDGDKTLENHMSSSFPCYLFITKIKGNKATDVT